ncbi:MAG: helix-turn-helix domain-containing protein [Microthrixaceae bacterium]
MATRDTILDSAVEGVALYGLAKLSMSDVASLAGISRPTLYKHFGSKDELVAAAVQREAVALVEAVLAEARDREGPRAALEAAVVTALRQTREHPLLDRIIVSEPETRLPYLTTDRIGGDGGAGGAAVLLFVRTATETLIEQYLGEALDDLTRRRLADVVARLLVSYAISAPDDPPEVVASSMATILLDGALTAGARPEETP